MEGRKDGEMDGRRDGWLDEGSTHGKGLGAAPEGGEDSEGGLCADNKLPSSEEGELGKDMQVLQDRVTAESPHICLWRQESLPAAAAESSFHRALQRHRVPQGPLPTASLEEWSPDADTEGCELTASVEAPRSQPPAEQPLTKITEPTKKDTPQPKTTQPPAAGGSQLGRNSQALPWPPHCKYVDLCGCLRQPAFVTFGVFNSLSISDFTIYLYSKYNQYIGFVVFFLLLSSR